MLLGRRLSKPTVRSPVGRRLRSHPAWSNPGRPTRSLYIAVHVGIRGERLGLRVIGASHLQREAITALQVDSEGMAYHVLGRLAEWHSAVHARQGDAPVVHGVLLECVGTSVQADHCAL